MVVNTRTTLFFFFNTADPLAYISDVKNKSVWLINLHGEITQITMTPDSHRDINMLNMES